MIKYPSSTPQYLVADKTNILLGTIFEDKIEFVDETLKKIYSLRPISIPPAYSKKFSGRQVYLSQGKLGVEAFLRFEFPRSLQACNISLLDHLPTRIKN